MSANVKARFPSIKEAFLRREVLTTYAASHFALACVLISHSVLPVYVKHIGGSDFAAGLQGTVFTVAGVVMRFFLGPMADKKGRLLPLRIGAFAFMTAPLLIWISPNLWVMAVARIYQAIGLATYLASASSYITDIIPDEYHGTGLGLYRMVVTLSLMIAPPISMHIISVWGFDAFFLFYTAVGGASFLGVMTLPNRSSDRIRPGGYDRIEKNEYEEHKVELKEIALLFRNSKVSSSYIGILIGSAFGGILMTYLALYVERTTDIPNPALFFTIYAGIGALTSAVAGRLSDRYGRRGFITPMMLCMAVGLLLLFLLPQLPGVLFVAAAVLTGIGYHAGLAVFISRVVDGSDKRLKATALAFQESSIDLGISGGVFVFGLLSELFSFDKLFLGAAVLAAASPILVLRMDRGRAERK